MFNSLPTHTIKENIFIVADLLDTKCIDNCIHGAQFLVGRPHGFTAYVKVITLEFTNSPSERD
jgi:hypothetical protein